MRKYTIQPGQSNFRPFDSWLPRFNVRRFTVRALFRHSCYFSLTDWENDKDWHDWNKLKGITDFFSANNSRSCMVAWRPDKKNAWFQVAAYMNYPGTDVQITPLGIVQADTEFSVEVRMNGDEAMFEYSDGLVRNTARLHYRRPWVSREIGTWMGGANNEPGPYGGKATQYMELEAEVKY